MKSHETHQPCDVDGPHGLISGQWDGPTGTFWPNSATLRGCTVWTGRGNIHGPSAGGVESWAYQSEQQLAPRTKPATGANSPSWTSTLIKLEWAHTERATWFRDSMRGADWWRDITWGSLNTRGDSRGYPHGYTFPLWKRVLARVGDWSKEPMNKVEQSREVPFHAWRCHHGLPRVSRS